MKKFLWIALILMLVCILSFSACDQEDTPPNNGDVPSTQQPSDNNDDGPADNNNSDDTNTQCQHAWGEWFTIKQATCKDEGQLIRVCGKCSVSEQTTVAKTETHTEVIDAAISATCTEDGKTEGKHCSVCGITLVEQTTIKAKGHTEIVDEAVAATCKTEGKTEGKHCSVCNDIIVKQTVIPKSGHTEVIDEAVTPTCTTEGKTEGKHCSICGTIIVEQANVPKSNHTEVVDDAVSPTCTTEGKTEGKHCSVCKKVIVAQTSIDIVDHTFDNGACSVCKCMDIDSKNAEIATENQRYEQAISDNYSVYIDLVSETEDEISHRKSTYNISYVYNSDYCRQEMSEIEEEMTLLKKYIDVYSTGDWGDEVQAKLQRYKVQYAKYKEQYEKYEQMLIINGLYDYIDTYEENYNESLSELESIHEENLEKIEKKYECAVNGHNEVIDKASAPTCTATGKTEGSHCSNCGFVITAQSTIENLGHTEVIDPAVAETCTTDGKTQGSHCSVCGDIIVAQEAISKHHTEVIDPAVAETCTTDGKTEGKHCSVCGDILVAQEIIEKHHTEVIDPAVAETCTTDGKTQGSHCSVCGDIIVAQETIAKHHTEVIDEAVSPTCTAEGKTEGKHCSVCDEILIAQSIIPMKAHLNGNWASTDIETKINRLCNNCDAVLETKTVSAGLKYTLNSDGVSYCVSDYGICSNERVIIPNVYNNLPVTSIGRSAFYGCTNIISIEIPNSVTSIEPYAFAYCTGLTQVNIPTSMTTIKEATFFCCSNLTSITIPENIISILDNAFGCCSKLVEIYNLSSIKISTDYGSFGYEAKVIHTSSNEESILETVDNYIFMTWQGKYYLMGYASNDSELVLPDNYQGQNYSIYKYAFSERYNITSIIIPEGVTAIEMCAFADCKMLTNVVISSSVTSINTINTFDNCVRLTSIIVDENNTRYKSLDGNLYTKDGKTLIKYAAGKDDTSFAIQDGVTKIEVHAFSDCSSLTNIIVSNTVTNIGANAFWGCTNLLSIIIPKSVTKMGHMVFTDCDNLKVYCEAESQPLGWHSNWNYSDCPVVWGYVLTSN